MAKSLTSEYATGARGRSWLKIKRAHTLDLVILAAEWGSGRRKGWLSNLHLGARDEQRGGFAMLGKTFKGLTDEMLAWQTVELLRLEIARDAHTVFVEPEAGCGDCFQRYPGKPAIRERAGIAIRAREALSNRQKRGSIGHISNRAIIGKRGQRAKWRPASAVKNDDRQSAQRLDAILLISMYALAANRRKMK